MSGCSEDKKQYGESGTPTIGNGQYCWCKVTGYKPANSNVVNAPYPALSWTFLIDRTNASECAMFCAPHCAYDIGLGYGFRYYALTPTNN